MIRYWPDNQGIDLNIQVSNLFKKVYIKLNFNLYNTTSHLLSIDIVNSYFKQELFKIILLELEILILDIIELDININDICTLNQKILIDLISKSIISCQQIFKINIQELYNIKSQSSNLISSRRIKIEHRLLLQNLLIYLVFGGAADKTNLYLFPNSRIPSKHVEILLDNLVIQLADIIFYELIEYNKSTLQLFEFLKLHNICRSTYISARSIATFKNNLVWYNYIAYYFTQPRIIYNNRYQVWIFSTKGLNCQYIYASREQDIKLLSHIQFLIVVLLEFQDFVTPKIQNLLIILGKVWVYLIRYVLSNSLKVILKSISIVMRSKS
uniref:Ycf55 n=1 Tax=Dichotomaria marginata TaxID=268567 RepID=A0A1G4NSC4_9FLOR|nr:Hypothetical protein ycf55 [Dichotomaria marginata]SCW21466.1 Hypothetical protein ycf55 [Dichotomaria marginata]